MKQNIAATRIRTILHIDSMGGLAAGFIVLLLHGILAQWYGLPERIVLFIALANIAYGSYSGGLVLYTRLKALPHRRSIFVLIAANLLWPLVCVILLVMNKVSISFWGTGHLLLEGLYVGLLGALELILLKKIR